MMLKRGFLSSGKGIGETRYKSVTVCTGQGRTQTVVVPPQGSISDWKTVIASKTKVPTDFFRLTWKGEPLDECNPAAVYSIEEGETLVMVSEAPSPQQHAREANQPHALEASQLGLEAEQHVPAANRPEPEINQPKLEAQPEPEAIWPKKATKQRSRRRAAAKRTEANMKVPPCADSDDVSTTLPSDGDNPAAQQVGKSKRRRQRHQLQETRAAARAAAIRQGLEPVDIREGSVLDVQEDGPIYKSSKSWDQIGAVKTNMQVVAAGPPEMSDGYVMVPIKRGGGALELRILAPHHSETLLTAAPHPELCFSVLVKTEKGRERKVSVSSGMLIAALKESISKATLVPSSRMRLMFKGEDLQDDRYASDYGISTESVLQIGCSA